MSTSFLLIGHRCTGKTTLGRQLATTLRIPFVDLDDVIAEREGKSASELVEEIEARFRSLEHEHLRELLSEDTTRVIACGAGIVDIPLNAFVIWISREGWEECARDTRARLRSDLSWEAEVSWMQATREERYRRSAHARLHLERDCSVNQAASRLFLLADWLRTSVQSPIMQMSWMRPRSRDDLTRCVAQVELFGMAGIEIRSDMFDELPDIDVPMIAALRTSNDDFFSLATRAVIFDCDATLLEHMDLDKLQPRTLILSVHPDDVFREYFDYLLGLSAYIAQAMPSWRDLLLLKYAPRVKSWVELRYAYQLYKVHEKSGARLSFFPQGKRWNWMRIQRLFGGNQLNYISSGCEEYSTLPPTVDFFLPYIQTTVPVDLYGVIGAEAHRSIGDFFHQYCARLSKDAGFAYVKIPLNSTEIDNCLHLLPQLGFRGLSVTTPLKRAIAESNFVGCNSDLRAGNTLVLLKGSFMLEDTDETGMLAALDEIEAAGVTPGETVLYGSGGVADALKRALVKRNWSPVHILSARDGWRTFPAKRVQLIVNASGADAGENAPVCEAWLDLRYSDIEIQPPSARTLFNGMTLYKHQALAQRNNWGRPSCDSKTATAF